jgi:uncharacterized membrane protein
MDAMPDQMKTLDPHSGSRKQSPIKALFASALVGLVCSGAATAAPTAKYRLVVLPPLAGTSSAQVTAINNRDEVVGTVTESVFGAEEPVIWNEETPALVFNPVPFSAVPAALNDEGIVVGGGAVIGAWAWSLDGGEVSLSYYSNSSANGINTNGVIVGFQGGGPISWASPFGETGPLPDLPLQNEAPVAINNAGVVVGFALSLYDETYQAARFVGSSYKNLGTLGGPNSEAVAVNDRGVIAGSAQIGNGDWHATRWGATTGPYNLGTLGGKQSYGNAINIQGDIAGTAQTATGAWHAVLWTHADYLPTDLNHEISPADSKAYTLISASGTNNRCRVVANGIDNKTGASHAFILYLNDPKVQMSCSAGQ